MKNHGPCDEWEELLALRPEDLSPTDRANLEKHLADCPSCTAIQVHYQHILSRLHALPTPIMEPLPRLTLRRAEYGQMGDQLGAASERVEQDYGHVRRDNSTGSRKTLLVIDDNSTIVELIKHAVNLQGEYDVIVAYDSLQGLERAYADHPDCIVIDLKMPRIDGYQFVRRLRADSRFATTPLIILTARTPEEDQMVGLLSSIDEYLTKPFKPSTLNAAIAQVLRKIPAVRSAFYVQTQAERDESQ
jgi:CheY-like chemotaxis protein